MRNKESAKHKIILGAIIGGLIGGTALYLLNRSSTHKPLLNRVGQALSNLGEMIEESEISNTDEAIDEIEKSLPKENNILSNALTWVATGLNLWNKIKKGN